MAGKGADALTGGRARSRLSYLGALLIDCLAILIDCFTVGGVGWVRTYKVPPGPRASIVSVGPPAIGRLELLNGKRHC
jgi:hypothetical protein